MGRMFDNLATQIAHDVAKAIELVGIVIIAAGAVINLALFARRSFDAAERGEALAALRSNFGRSILLGLEFLIAADIINTVAVTPTLQSVIVLGAFAWQAVWDLLGERRPPFGHGAAAEVDGRLIIASYHPSQQNTFTGKLTAAMLDDVITRATAHAVPDP